jgi:hypothetical protein
MSCDINGLKRPFEVDGQYNEIDQENYICRVQIVP